MVDSHCHLADAAFEPDLDAVVARAREAGVERALVILDARSTDEAARAERLRRLWPDVRFAVGVYPHDAAGFAGNPTEVERVVAAAIDGNELVRAVGEAGLEYHYDPAPREIQREVFGAQVRLARTRELPIVVHTRDADEDTVRVLREEGGGDVRGVMHCFTGDAAFARAALDLGFHIAFSGIVTFPRAGDLRDVAKVVPDDRLLLETDSPFLAPVPHRGKPRNEPAWVAHVAEVVAAERRVDVHTLREQTTRNFDELFRP